MNETAERSTRLDLGQLTVVADEHELAAQRITRSTSAAS